VAKDLTFSGRIVGGIEAVALGLATRVADDPRAAALALAAEIASKSPSAIRAAKRLLNGSVSVDAAEGLALEQRLQAGLLGRPNQVEAVRSNLEKRAPRWVDTE
jgi:enoyl-CoA hydratase/carnithine racemase